MTGQLRPVRAEVDLGAIRRNAQRLRAAAGGSALCAVVKAQAYGHGAVPVARSALEGGATWLGVALVEEGAELRDAGIDAPVLLLSEPTPDAATWDEIVGRRLTPTVYTAAGVEAAAKAVSRAGGDAPLPVHVKVDTGMHRVGAAPDDAVELATTVAASRELLLDGLFTHFAVADEAEGDEFTAAQVAALHAVADRLAARPRLLHACNSAGLLTRPEAHLDLVRCGIALYGLAPSLELAGACADLEPAMAVVAAVSYVKPVAAGERCSYGLRYRFERDSWAATVPIGYADGVPRALGAAGGEVLIGGRRRRIAGTVTMDQIVVDCGDDTSVAVGDEVVVLGRQGGESVTAWEWAQRTGTIAYETVCGISGRVPRVWV